ncbi:MAG TPA: DNA polymerase III subunit beta, partial [Ktedonobacterales bacterium]|nr:DNA polymerase III subunit beta [Ktedonobacterales bacterium]
MKLTCKQQDLAKGLSIVSHAVSTRTTLPILSHILVATEGDAVRLSATNLEIGITCRVPANVKEEGTTTVPARLFTDFVNSLPPAGVDLALQPESQSLKVSGQRSQATIRGMDPSEFPSIPAAEGSETPVILDAKELREMIAQTTFAAATDDARPVFTGVLARVHGGELIFAAADSFRLAVRRTALPGEAADGDVLIPARTLGELAKILPAEGMVRMVV